MFCFILLHVAIQFSQNYLLKRDCLFFSIDPTAVPVILSLFFFFNCPFVVLGLHCYACFSLVVAHRLLIVVTSLVAENGLR